MNAVETKVRKASQLLQEAYEASPCKWCARNLDKLSKVTSDMADIAPYTEETAKRISSKSQQELDEVGGKVAVLKRVVLDAQNDGNITDVNESLNIQDGPVQGRGLFMDKSKTTAALGAAGIGGLMGFALNRVNEMVTPNQPFYMSVAPWGNIIGGLVLTYLSSSKYIKGPGMSMAVLGGGLGMISQGTTAMIEGVYRMTVPSAGLAPGRRYVNARVPGQLPVRVVQTTKSF